LAGEKILEFRRIFAKQPVDFLVIYSSSPKKRIVAIAKIQNVHEASPTALWNLSRTKSPGITRQELYRYFFGKSKGFAIEISSVMRANGEGIDPTTLFENFNAPQSFRYLDPRDYLKIASYFKA
jgi:predicted transcriptional regulator